MGVDLQVDLALVSHACCSDLNEQSGVTPDDQAEALDELKSYAVGDSCRGELKLFVCAKQFGSLYKLASDVIAEKRKLLGPMASVMKVAQGINNLSQSDKWQTSNVDEVAHALSTALDSLLEPDSGARFANKGLSQAGQWQQQ